MKRKSLKRKNYRIGTLVYIGDERILKSSFGCWPKCRVFKVSEDSISSNKKRYIWLDSYSVGIEPAYVRMTTSAERKNYHAEIKEYKKSLLPF